MPTTSRGTAILAQQHGCWIAIHEIANAVYEHRPLRDGDRIEVGNIALDVFHTPGHRPEHCCIVVSDRTRGDEPWLVLSGDALFVGDSGRPDLAVAGDEGAAALYRSLHERLRRARQRRRALPRPRGRLAVRPRDVGQDVLHARLRAALQPDARRDDRGRFVKLANADLAPKPPTMARIVELNRGPLLGVAPAARTVAQPAADAQVLDVRDGASFADGHMAGSFNDSVETTGFGNRCGFALDPEREVVIVAATHEQAEDAARKLAAVGFTQLAEVGFGVDSAHALERFEPIGLVEMGALADNGAAAGRGRARAIGADASSPPDALAVPYRLLADADLSALDPVAPHRGRLPHRDALAARGVAAGAARLHARAARARRRHERLGSTGGRCRGRGRGGRGQGPGTGERLGRARHDRTRARGLTLAGARRGHADAGRDGARKRVRARRHPGDRPRRAARGRRDGLRARVPRTSFTVNVEFYTGEDERLELPILLPPVPDPSELAQRRVLICDDVADTGDTLALVQRFCERHVAEARTRRALREASLDRALRLRLAPHRSLDHVRLERAAAGRRRRGDARGLSIAWSESPESAGCFSARDRPRPFGLGMPSISASS